VLYSITDETSAAGDEDDRVRCFNCHGEKYVGVGRREVEIAKYLTARRKWGRESGPYLEEGPKHSVDTCDPESFVMDEFVRVAAPGKLGQRLLLGRHKLSA
jgi:hypothetical protein